MKIEKIKEELQYVGESRQGQDGLLVVVNHLIGKVNEIIDVLNSELMKREEVEKEECKHDWVDIILKDKWQWRAICMKCFEVEAGVMGTIGNCGGPPGPGGYDGCGESPGDLLGVKGANRN